MICSKTTVRFWPEAAPHAVVLDYAPRGADLVNLLSSIGPYISDTTAVRRQAEQRLGGSYVNAGSLAAE